MASSSGYFCADCSHTSDSKNDLECKKHTVCKDCLVKRALSKPQSIFGCTLCEVPDKDSLLDEDRIWIFVDDSNIWIEAKKLQGKAKGFKASEDHRVRIDMGKLADLIANGRHLHEGVLYGSEPAPVDKVWKKIEQKGFRISKHKRSKVTGKEKQVDSSLVADITKTATKTPMTERGTIAVVSGDADVIPALDAVLEEDGWKIEVYMWRHAIAKALNEYADKHNDRVTVIPLNQYRNDFTFTNMDFPIESNPHLESKAKQNGVVFTMEANAFKNNIPDKAWRRELESIAQWPFQYFWFERNEGEFKNLVVLFRDDKGGKGRKFDIPSFIKIAGPDNRYHIPKVMQLQTYLDFVEQIELDDEMYRSSASLEQVEYYNQDDICAGSDNEKNSVSDSEEEPSEQCQFGYNCYFGTGCHREHTEKEKRYFSQRNGRGNPVRKTVECTHFARNQCCKRNKSECDFAHGPEDAWCLQCRTVGHYGIDCPQK